MRYPAEERVKGMGRKALVLERAHESPQRVFECQKGFKGIVEVESIYLLYTPAIKRSLALLTYIIVEIKGEAKMNKQ